MMELRFAAYFCIMFRVPTNGHRYRKSDPVLCNPNPEVLVTRWTAHQMQTNSAGYCNFQPILYTPGKMRIWKNKIFSGECHTYQEAVDVFQITTWYHGVLELSAIITRDIFGNTITSLPTISLHHHSKKDNAV